jgi:ATP-binding protein involved in chromosome partitioning
LVDLPPGTGDASLSLAQLVPLTGAVIVLTPSEVALQDGAKAIAMFKKLNVPVLGIIENMSYFNCPHCNGPVDIFGRGTSKRLCAKFEVDYLGDLPLDPAVRIGGDDGLPVTISDPDGASSQRFIEVAKTLAGKVSVQTVNAPKFVPINVVATPRG